MSEPREQADDRDHTPRRGRSYLLKGLVGASRDIERCHGLARAAVQEPADLAVLHVSYSETPEAVTATWRERHDELPGRLLIVYLGPTGPGAVPADDRVAVETASPTDLTGLGLRLRDGFEASEGYRLQVCFDSLTALLQYHDVEPAFRLLNMLGQQVREAGATAHVHLDSAAHDEQTVRPLQGLFDDVIEG